MTKINLMLDNVLNKLKIKYNYKEEMNAYFTKVNLPNDEIMNIALVVEDKIEAIKLIAPTFYKISNNTLRQTKNYIAEFNLNSIVYGTLSVHEFKKRRSVTYTTGIMITKSKSEQVLLEELQEIFSYVGFLHKRIGIDLDKNNNALEKSKK
ncbi:hypothetical protein V2B35_14730 [Bacillus safensis]|uniref:hypothetical protein n=1 Tax=Bacillus TaxID=1386 RepID=UPI000F792372|nr:MULTISPECIES: hypothetical protein [Bacillus]MCM3368614.1 hypothetical protein [Bacillus safensis]MDJ0291933.1 hypothetical protein [Bacillus safensis]NMW03432.1 hypothetical protein [Bacillus safensis]